MMDKLIRWSLENRPLVLVAALLLTVFGIHTATRMPVDVFPDLTAPTVTVITEAHGMAPTEVENQVTFPIETAVNGASGVRRVRSGNFLEENHVGPDQPHSIAQLMQDELAVEKSEPFVDVHCHDLDGTSQRIAGLRRICFKSLEGGLRYEHERSQRTRGQSVKEAF
jgi:hypothetical protein